MSENVQSPVLDQGGAGPRASGEGPVFPEAQSSSTEKERKAESMDTGKGKISRLGG